MDNKLRKLAREIVEELVDCGCVDPEPVQQYLTWTETKLRSALLAELEAKDKRIAEMEAKRATPVRLPQRKAAYASGYGDGYLVDSDGGDCFDRDDVIEALCEQGFIVEGEHVAAEKSE